MSALSLFPKRIKEPKKMELLEMEAFDALSKIHYRRWTRPILDYFTARTALTKGRILDVACGPGLLSKELGASKKFQITGIDISPHALRIARANTRGMRNISFRQGSVYKLPFNQHTFEAVVCKDSFHHFDRPMDAVKEMLRVIRPGGFLYIQDMRRDLPEYLIRRSAARKSVIEKLQYYSTRAAYTKAEVREMLKKIKIVPLELATPTVTETMKRTYPRLGIRINELREGFQARYNLLIEKSATHGASSTI